jgi:hypothetical protein
MADTDKNYYSIADRTDVTIRGVVLDPRNDGIDPSTIDDVLKLSHATSVLVEEVVVDAGGLQKENAIDMNRVCSDVVVRKCKLVSGKQNAVTIKGGCYDITLDGVDIVPGTGHCDIELGNWSDQSQDYVRDITLRDVKRTDGKPVRLRVGHAKNITIIGGNVKEDKLASLMVKIYWQYRKIFG